MLHTGGGPGWEDHSGCKTGVIRLVSGHEVANGRMCRSDDLRLGSEPGPYTPASATRDAIVDVSRSRQRRAKHIRTKRPKMKSFLFIVLLLAGGAAFYFYGGKEMIDQCVNPAPLPETIEVNHATFIGDEQGNPFAH